MTTKEFIEKAIEGGWEGTDGLSLVIGSVDNCYGLVWDEEMYKTIHEIILDPKAWEAVGKVEEFKDNGTIDLDHHIAYTHGLFNNNLHIIKMHQMIDHLVSGGTITSYLETL